MDAIIRELTFEENLYLAAHQNAALRPLVCVLLSRFAHIRVRFLLGSERAAVGQFLLETYP